MAQTQLDKTKRKAAGHLFLGLFSAQCGIANFMANHVLRENSSGLTEQERVIVQKWFERGHKQADLYRQMGWLLLGATHVGSRPRRKRARR
jgi:hypothetical protein